MFQLRDYQQEIVEKTRKHIKTGKQNILIQSPAGSGKSVIIADIVKKATDKGTFVVFLAHRRELLDNIKETLEKNEVDLNKMLITSPTKLYNKIKKGDAPKSTLIIVDEGHHTKAKTYQEIFNYYNNSIKLGFSATPWRLNGEGFEDTYDAMVEGPTVEWLIENESLAPYRWFSLPEINRKNIDFSSNKKIAETSEKEIQKSVIQGDIVEHFLKHAKDEQAIVYASSVLMSAEIAESFVRNGINAVHVDSDTPNDKRDEIMRKFKNKEIKVLCNVDLISEGFNVPDCSCVILCRPTKSLVLHIQQSMRAMRYKQGKTAIILDHVGNGLALGLPDMPYEWSLKGRDKKKKGKQLAIDSNLVECKTCGQLINMKTIIDNKCNFCGEEFPINKKDPKMEIDKSVELVELTKSDIYKNNKFDPKKGILHNVNVAKARAFADNKKNPIYKFFGALCINFGMNFSETELTQIAQAFEMSEISVKKAYLWAVNRRKKK